MPAERLNNIANAKTHVTAEAVRYGPIIVPSPRVASPSILRCLVLLIVSMAAILLVLEIGTRQGFRLVSKIESRTMTEAQGARLLQPFIDGKPSALLVGNSLMLDDVDYPALKQELAGRSAVRRFVVEQTYYYDWYFGIRRLFDEGARPSVIVLGIQPAAIPVNQIRGDYSAYYLFSVPDLLSVARAVDYDLTKTSSLVFARFSLFYAGRNNLRNFILNKVDPGYAELLHNLVTTPGHAPVSAEAVRISVQRLTAINEMCQTYGVKFIYFVPPALGNADERVLQGIRSAGIRVLEPFKPNQLPDSYFRDGFHLNEKGAGVLTSRLGEELSGQLAWANTIAR